MRIRENYKALMNAALRDIKIARHTTTAKEIFTEEVCIHCQQCAEKALKSFLDFNTVDYPFIHDLEKLNSECVRIDNAFSQLNISCAILNNYSSDFRYIDNSEILLDEMYEAIKLAEEVYSFVKAKIKED